MIIRKWKNPGIITIKLAVATVDGFRPLVGFTEEIEKAWEKLKKKHRLKQRPPKLLLKNASTTELDILTQKTISIIKVEKEEEEKSRQPQRSKTFADANSVFSKFRKMEATQIEEKKDDVYDKSYVPKKFSKISAEYGTPKPGTLCEMRAKKASKHIAREMAQICEIIYQYGKKSEDGKATITFKQLFDVYTYISDKVVGILLRARKHKMVDFEGEMLFQRRDDAVIITVLLTPAEIKAAYANVET